MTMDQFEQKLERDKIIGTRSDKIKRDRWLRFWHFATLVRGGAEFHVDHIPFTLHINHKTYHIDDEVSIFYDDKIIWHGFDEKGELIVLTLTYDKIVNLIFQGQVLYGKVVNINEKDDSKIPDLLKLTCEAGDVKFKVSI